MPNSCKRLCGMGLSAQDWGILGNPNGLYNSSVMPRGATLRAFGSELITL